MSIQSISMLCETCSIQRKVKLVMNKAVSKFKQASHRRRIGTVLMLVGGAMFLLTGINYLASESLAWPVWTLVGAVLFGVGSWEIRRDKILKVHRGFFPMLLRHPFLITLGLVHLVLMTHLTVLGWNQSAMRWQAFLYNFQILMIFLEVTVLSWLALRDAVTELQSQISHQQEKD